MPDCSHKYKELVYLGEVESSEPSRDLRSGSHARRRRRPPLAAAGATGEIDEKRAVDPFKTGTDETASREDAMHLARFDVPAVGS